jgi:hemerythrin superfamily protein
VPTDHEEDTAMMPSSPPGPPEPEDEYERLEHRREVFTEEGADPALRPHATDAGGLGAPAMGGGVDRPLAPDIDPGTPDSAYGFDRPDGTQRTPAGSPPNAPASTGYDGADAVRDQQWEAGATEGADELRTEEDERRAGVPERSNQPGPDGELRMVDEPEVSRGDDGLEPGAGMGAAGEEPIVDSGTAAGVGRVETAADIVGRRPSQDSVGRRPSQDSVGQRPSQDSVGQRPSEGVGLADAEVYGVTPGQEITGEPGGPQDMISILMSDHRTVDQLFVELEGGSAATPERRRDIVDVLIAELMRHSAAEEQYLYPAARQFLSAGEDLAGREVAEHARVEELMNDLIRTDAEDFRFDELVGRLISEVRQHVQEEESELFPQLRRSVDAETLVRLGTEILSAKKLAPTRPHPAAPDHPPMNKVAGPLAGLIDQAMDSLTDRPTSVEDLRDDSRL